jgi:hypothetical protein
MNMGLPLSLLPAYAQTLEAARALGNGVSKGRAAWFGATRTSFDNHGPSGRPCDRRRLKYLSLCLSTFNQESEKHSFQMIDYIGRKQKFSFPCACGMLRAISTSCRSLGAPLSHS